MLGPLHERPRNLATLIISARERSGRSKDLMYIAWHYVHPTFQPCLQYLTPFEWTHMFIISSILTIAEGGSNDIYDGHETVNLSYVSLSDELW